MIDNFFLSRRQGYIKAINNPILFLEMIKPTRSNIKWDALESDAKFTAKGDNGVRPIPEKWWAILPFNSWFHIYEKMGTGNLVQRELQERNGTELGIRVLIIQRLAISPESKEASYVLPTWINAPELFYRQGFPVLVDCFPLHLPGGRPVATPNGANLQQACTICCLSG